MEMKQACLRPEANDAELALLLLGVIDPALHFGASWGALA